MLNVAGHIFTVNWWQFWGLLVIFIGYFHAGLEEVGMGLQSYSYMRQIGIAHTLYQ